VRQPDRVGTEGQRATSEQTIEDVGEADEYRSAYDEADHIDKDILGKLNTQALGARVSKGPVAIEDEIADNGEGKRDALGNHLFEANDVGEEIEDGIIDDGASSADDAELDESLLFFAGR